MASESEPTAGGAPPATNAMARRAAAFGYRNIAYVVFVLLTPFGMWAGAMGPHGPDSGGGIWAAILLWALVSAVFFVVNAVLLAIALAKDRPAGKPAIACLLPILCIILPLIAEPLMVGSY